jgi:uncharacterized membrane protein YhiD involved in acid resistance
MEALVTIAILMIGITKFRQLERKVRNQAEKIYTLEQLLEMNLIKDGKEKDKASEATDAKEAKA